MEILLLDPTLRQLRISYEWLITSSLERIRHLAIAMAAGGRLHWICVYACIASFMADPLLGPLSRPLYCLAGT